MWNKGNLIEQLRQNRNCSNGDNVPYVTHENNSPKSEKVKKNNNLNGKVVWDSSLIKNFRKEKKKSDKKKLKEKNGEFYDLTSSDIGLQYAKVDLNIDHIKKEEFVDRVEKYDFAHGNHSYDNYDRCELFETLKDISRMRKQLFGNLPKINMTKQIITSDELFNFQLWKAISIGRKGDLRNIDKDLKKVEYFTVERHANVVAISEDGKSKLIDIYLKKNEVQTLFIMRMFNYYVDDYYHDGNAFNDYMHTDIDQFVSRQERRQTRKDLLMIFDKGIFPETTKQLIRNNINYYKEKREYKKKYSQINENDKIEVNCYNKTLYSAIDFVNQRFTKEELDEFRKTKKIRLTKNESNIVNSLEKINSMCGMNDFLEGGYYFFEDPLKIRNDIIKNNGEISPEVLKLCEEIQMRRKKVDKWVDEQLKHIDKKGKDEEKGKDNRKLMDVDYTILKLCFPFFCDRFTKEEIDHLENKSKKSILLTDHEIKVYNCMKWISETSLLKNPFDDCFQFMEDGQIAICKCAFITEHEIQMTGEIPEWLKEECKKRGKIEKKRREEWKRKKEKKKGKKEYNFDSDSDDDY